MRNPRPKKSPLFLAPVLAGTFLLAVVSAPAANIYQTITEATGSSNWNSSVWGTPNAVPASGGNYETTNTFALRTVSATTNQAFNGNSLQIDTGGILYLKHNNGVASATLILNGGAVTYHGGPGGTNAPVGGTLQVTANSTFNSDQTAPNESIWLLSPVSGSGNLTVALGTTTNGVVLFGTNSAYSGNWNVTSGFLMVGNGAASPLGAGTVTLVNTADSLTFNSTNNLTVTNAVSGNGSFLMENTGSVTLTGSNTFTGPLNVMSGLLTVSGSGTQASTVINSNGVLCIASGTAIPSGSTLTISPNNAMTGGLQLTNGITLATGNTISTASRTGPTVAIESLGGSNTISDAIGIFSGGTSPIGLQADAGSSLVLNGGISATVSGNRGVQFSGAGYGIENGTIQNGSATTVTVSKTGAGTWTLNAANYYTGITSVTNGMLQLGASGSINSSAGISLQAGGTFDATPVSGGLALAGSQLLTGSGTVLGAVTTSSGSLIEPGITNQYGQALTLSNALTLSGGETVLYQLTGTSNNVLNVNGALTLNGTTTIQIVLPTGIAGLGTFRLINYTGTLQGGGSFTLTLPGASSQTFTLDTSTPGQVNLVVTGLPQTLVWSGDGSANTWDVNTTSNWNSGTKIFNQGDYVTFNDSGSVVPDIYVSTAVIPGSFTISNSAEAYIFDGAGISSSSGLVKQGTNLVAFTGTANNFSGPISIQAGIVSIGNGGAVGSLGTGPVTNNGELLVNSSSGVLTLGNTISGSGSVQLTGGGAQVNLTASNSYAGGTVIGNNCLLSVLNNYALGVTNTGTLVQSGGRVGFTSLGNWTVAQPIQINGYGVSGLPGALYANTGNNRVTLTGPVTVGSASQIRIVNTNVWMTFSNSVTGSGQTLQCTANDTGSLLAFDNTFSLGNDPVLAALTKDGAGTLLLAGSSNLCGSVTINAGTVQITTTNSPQIGNVTVNTGTLLLGSGLGDGSLPNGTISLVGGSTMLTVNSSNTFALNTQLTGAGGLSASNYATLILSASNTFAGNVVTGNGVPIPGAIIVLSNSFGLGDGTASKTVTLIHASLQMHGDIDIPAAISFQTSSGNSAADTNRNVAYVIRSVSGTNTIEGNISPTGGANNTIVDVDAGLLVLNGTVAPVAAGRTLILTGSGNGLLNGAVNNNGTNILGLTMQGAGTWTCTNAETYSGNTLIQGGTLVLGATASIATTPLIQLAGGTLNVAAVSGGFAVGSTQTVAGVGNVAGAVTVNGTAAPGPLGTLTFTNGITLAGTTVMELNRTNAQNADRITGGSVVLGGTLTVTNLGAALQAGDSFQLFTGTLSGSFTATNLPALSATNLSWDLSLLNTSGLSKVAGGTLPVPNITASYLSGTNLVMQVASSQSGASYILQATPTLTPPVWTNVKTNAGGGTVTFTIPVSPTAAQQFYRVGAQ